LQRSVLAELQDYYRNNLDALNGSAIHEKVKTFSDKSPEEQLTLIDEIKTGLRKHCIEVLKQQGIALLGDV
jgi:hypothetical protein